MTQSLVEWLNGFRALHERARAGKLAPKELALYHGGRDELARALLAAQRLTVPAGQAPRRAVRVSRALQADLEFVDGNVRAMTVDVSARGFAALLARPPRPGEELKVSLRLPGAEPLRAEARVVEVRPQVGNARVSFELVGLGEAEAERLELFVFDAVLSQLAPR